MGLMDPLKRRISYKANFSSLLYQSDKLLTTFMGDTSFLIKAMISPMARGIKNILSHAPEEF